MILRRDFIKSMAFAALATVFPDIPLPKEPEPEVLLVSPDKKMAIKYIQSYYALGFEITDELMQDNLYGEGIQELATRYQVAIDDWFIKEFE